MLQLNVISYTNFNNIVTNKTKSIKYSTLTNLCNILNCTPNDLFTKTNNNTKSIRTILCCYIFNSLYLSIPLLI